MPPDRVEEGGDHIVRDRAFESIESIKRFFSVLPFRPAGGSRGGPTPPGVTPMAQEHAPMLQRG